MTEFAGLPWPSITAAAGGWTLFGLTMIGLITGRWIVTRREADRVERMLIRDAEDAKKARDEAVVQNREMLRLARLVEQTFAAIKGEADGDGDDEASS